MVPPGFERSVRFQSLGAAPPSGLLPGEEGSFAERGALKNGHSVGVEGWDAQAQRSMEPFGSPLRIGLQLPLDTLLTGRL